MVKRLYIIFSILLIAIIPTSILKISNEEYSINIKTTYKETIGRLIINKINIDEELYPINNKHNNIEEHVTILKESNMPNLLILAAHSGIGRIAYFQELNKLEINDEIIVYYKNKKYTYIIDNIWEEKKNGYIHINNSNKNQLILTTCSPNKEGYQLIVNCIEKESI